MSCLHAPENRAANKATEHKTSWYPAHISTFSSDSIKISTRGLCCCMCDCQVTAPLDGMDLRRNSLFESVADMFSDSQNNSFRHSVRRHTICEGSSDANDYLADIKEFLSGYVAEAATSVSSVISSAAGAVKTKLEGVMEEPASHRTNRHNKKDRLRDKYSKEYSYSRVSLDQTGYEGHLSSKQREKLKVKNHIGNNSRKGRRSRRERDDSRCSRQRSTGLHKHCYKVSRSQNVYSTNLQQLVSGSDKPKETKSQSDDALTLSKEKQTADFGTFENMPQTEHDIFLLPRSASQSKTMDTMCRSSLSSKNTRSIQSFVSLESNQDSGVESSRSSSTAEGWKMKEDGTVNIIPEPELNFTHTPHLRRRMKTSPKSLSKNELDYVYNKTEQKFLKRVESSNQQTFGNLNVSIQFLIISKRLKVTVKSVEPLKDFVEDGNNKLKRTFFVKVCFVPTNGGKQKRTKSASGRDFVEFDEDIYLKNVTFENVHLLTVRFQLYQKTSRLCFKRHLCVAESRVCLDNLDVIGRVTLHTPMLMTNI